MVTGEDPEGGSPVLDVPLPHAEAPSAPPRLLTHRPFLWLVGGGAFTQLGRWGFFLAAVGDATFRLHATPGQVALLVGVFSLSLIVGSPFYGAASDRWSPKWILVWNASAALFIPIIPLVTGSLGWLYVAMSLYGFQYASEMPAAGALVPRIVPKDRLVQANGMLAAAVAATFVIGPTLAGILVRFGRTGPYFVSIGAAVVSVAFYLAVPDRRKAALGPVRPLAEIGAGFREAWAKGSLRRLFLIATSIWFLIGVLISLEPSYVRQSLGKGQGFLALIWAVYGGGEVVGSILVSRIRKGSGREPTLIAVGLLLAAVGFLLYVAVPGVILTVAGNVVFGIGFPFYTSSAYALIQRVAQRPGTVTAALSMMGEGGPVVASVFLFATGKSLAVHPVLLGTGIVFSAVALLAVRAARVEPEDAGTAPEPAPAEP